MNKIDPELFGRADVIKPDCLKIIPFQVFNLFNILWVPLTIVLFTEGFIDFPFNLFQLAALWNFIALLIWNVRAKLDKDIYIRTGPEGLSISVPAFSNFFFLLKYEKDMVNLSWDQVKSMEPSVYTLNGVLQDIELKVESSSSKVYEIDLKYIIGFSFFNHDKKIDRLFEEIKSGNKLE